MNPVAEIWNILHDGTLIEVSGEIPGAVRLNIEIPYLRKFFEPSGSSFLVTLQNCTMLKMTRRGKAGDPYIIENFGDIAALKCWILSTDSEACPVKIDTTEGQLELDCSSITLSLDFGQSITHNEVCNACERYWKKFGQKRD